MIPALDSSDGPGRGGPRGSVQSSVGAILRHQEPNGAIVASRDFATYHYCWLRDGSFIAFALDRAGEHPAAERFHRWAATAIGRIGALIDDATERADRGEPPDLEHMPPARFGLDGAAVADDWPNFQIDGYGTWLWSLEQHLRVTGVAGLPDALRESVTRAARYISALALTNCYDVWEESMTARHGSTLACVFGGLMSGARMLGADDLRERAAAVRAAAVEPAARLGRYAKSSESDDVDASLLWLATPFGLVAPDDPALVATVAMIEERLTLEGGLRRYSHDTYYGSGAWPVLTASLGWHYAVTGERSAAQRCHGWVVEHFDEQGKLAEQFGGDRRDPDHYREWVERWGLPAADLAWSHAMHIVLSTELDGAER
jgi:GH15 family glucan-1,4-alpha-glucosidase